jgi:NADH-quinone oxidoreductase subunit G
MEGSPLPPPPGLINRYWSPGWNSVQSLTRFQEEIGGPLRGGDPGARLFEPASSIDGRHFDEVPEAFAPRDGEWLLVPHYHLFGSEALSMETAGVAEQAPEAYVALNPEDAKMLGVEDGDALEIEIDGHTGRVPVAITPGLPAGCVGLPEGLPAGRTIPSGRWARLRRPS